MIDNTKEYILCSAIWYDDGITRDDEKKSLDEGKERTFPAHFYGKYAVNNKTIQI